MKNPIQQTVDHFRAYAYGESCETFDVSRKHAIDLSETDAYIILKGLEALTLLATIEYPHNFQREREDIARYCANMTAIQKIAKKVISAEKEREDDVMRCSECGALTYSADTHCKKCGRVFV